MLNWLLQIILRILFHSILICTIIGACLMIVRTIFRSSVKTETFFRILAAVLGIAIYFVLRMLGLTVSKPLLGYLADEHWYFLLLFGLVIPAVVGGISAWAINHVYQKDDVIPARLFVLASTLLLILFTDTYAQAASAGGELQRSLLPNLAFALGMGLYVLLRVKIKSVY